MKRNRENRKRKEGEPQKEGGKPSARKEGDPQQGKRETHSKERGRPTARKEGDPQQGHPVNKE